MALTQTDSRIWLMEVESGRRLAELEAADPRIINGLALDLESGYLAASTNIQRMHVWDLWGFGEGLASMGVPWELPLSAKRAAGSGPIQVDALGRGDLPGVPLQLEDPRSPSVLRHYRRDLFLSRLESYGDVDAALASPRSLIPEGALWKFHRGHRDPSPAGEWTATDFDDSAWESGKSGFGSTGAKEITTSLDGQLGSYTTLYLRHAFTVEDPSRVEKLLLGLRFEDGFIAWLNGKEVARRNAGEAGSRPDCKGVAPARINLRQDFLGSLDASILVEGKNVLAIQGLSFGMDSLVYLLPVLAAALLPDADRDRGRTWNLSVFPPHSPQGDGPDHQGGPQPHLAAYRAGRLLQRAGELEESIGEFQRASELDPISPEPILRSIECLRARGEPEHAEALAREAIERRGLIDAGAVWVAWILTVFQDLHRPLRAVLDDWPRSPSRGRGERRAVAQPRKAGGAGYREAVGSEAGPGGDSRSESTGGEPGAEETKETRAEDLGSNYRAVMEELAAKGAVRINCGGGAFSPPGSPGWWADRFFLSGIALEVEDQSTKETPAAKEEARPYRSHRWFPGDRQLRPGYRVPLPPGRYRVSLHFAEVYHKSAGARSFSVLLERRTVLEGHDPFGPGFATLEVKSFEVEVTDGFLDVDFLAERDNPMVSGIEVEIMR